ncbi:MAG: transglutaminase domain-containing protein [Ferruginibacter sp.]
MALTSSCISQERSIPIHIPTKYIHSTSSIADYISEHYSSEYEKLLAIYSWVITNIHYDTDSMYAINWNMGGEAKVTEALRRKKGVCENFAAIFSDIANKAGLLSFVVDGYTKKGGNPDNSGHAWIAVRVENQWLLCDPTWDKDSPNALNYFLVDPASLIATHMPFDPMWQLLEYPFTHAEFLKGRSPTPNRSGYFNFKDSIKVFLQLNKVQRLEAAGRRINPEGNTVEILRNHAAYNKMKVAIIYEEEDRNLYNAGVASLNDAVNKFNQFVILRNDPFHSGMKHKEISNLLQDISFDILLARNKIRRVGSVIPNEQYNTSAIDARLDDLSVKIQEQKYFVEKHFSAPSLQQK